MSRHANDSRPADASDPTSSSAMDPASAGPSSGQAHPGQAHTGHAAPGHSRAGQGPARWHAGSDPSHADAGHPHAHSHADAGHPHAGHNHGHPHTGSGPDHAGHAPDPKHSGHSPAGHEHDSKGSGHGHAGHSHAGHSHGREADARSLAWTFVLIVLFMGVELVGGWWTGSLALLADAGHMLSDAGALALSLFALWISRKPSTSRRTYGYLRAEILAALANGTALGAIALTIAIEALGRFQHPAPVVAGPMLAIAAGGLLVNLAGLFLLHGADKNNLNLRGAWLHVLSDALGSVGAILAGACILWFGWNWADAAASMLIALLILNSSWALLRETVAILMEEVPRHIDLDRVRQEIVQQPGVLGVHDLHIWTITSGIVAMSGHVAFQEGENRAALLRQTQLLLKERFDIGHATIQLEPTDFQDCGVGSRCDGTSGRSSSASSSSEA